MNKSLEELKQIVESAPEGVNCFELSEGYQLLPPYSLLSDLRRIIKLEEENQRLRGILVKVMEDYQIVASVAEREGYLTNYSELSNIVDSEFEENIGGETS